MHNTIKENYFKFGESKLINYNNRDQWGWREVIISKFLGIRLDYLEE